MKITSLKIWKMNLGNKRPYTIAFKTVDDVDSVFVKLTLDNGIYGVGAGNPSKQVVGESLEDSINTLTDDNLEFLIGRDIREFYKLLEEVKAKFPKTPAARAALDIAIHDAFTKYLDVPLAHFLGQKIEKMATSVTIGIKDVAETVAEAQEYYDLGFRVIKVKTGSSVEEDIARIKGIRERFGKDFTIRVDANQGYTVQELTTFYNDTAKDNIELIEQPLPAKAIDELKGLSNDIKEIIAADESLINPLDAFYLASPPKASGIFNIKLMKSGGIFPARQIATIAEMSSIDLMWGCNDESAVSISAALHTALCFPNTKYLDLDGSLDLVRDAVTSSFKIENGWMSISGASGLGVELDSE